MDIQEKIARKITAFVAENKGHPKRLYLGEIEYKELSSICPRPESFMGLGVYVVLDREHIGIA